MTEQRAAQISLVVDKVASFLWLASLAFSSIIHFRLISSLEVLELGKLDK